MDARVPIPLFVESLWVHAQPVHPHTEGVPARSVVCLKHVCLRVAVKRNLSLLLIVPVHVVPDSLYRVILVGDEAPYEERMLCGICRVEGINPYVVRRGVVDMKVYVRWPLLVAVGDELYVPYAFCVGNRGPFICGRIIAVISGNIFLHDIAILVKLVLDEAVNFIVDGITVRLLLSRVIVYLAYDVFAVGRNDVGIAAEEIPVEVDEGICEPSCCHCWAESLLIVEPMVLVLNQDVFQSLIL